MLNALHIQHVSSTGFFFFIIIISIFLQLLVNSPSTSSKQKSKTVAVRADHHPVSVARCSISTQKLRGRVPYRTGCFLSRSKLSTPFEGIYTYLPLRCAGRKPHQKICYLVDYVLKYTKYSI